MFNFQPEPPEGALPPDEVRFVEIHVEPWPEGQRVRVHVELTPFQTRPNLDVIIVDTCRADEPEVASTTVIELIEAKLVFTMHLRGSELSGKYRLDAVISYDDLGKVDSWALEFDTPVDPGNPAE